jgi:hypothetical protein
MYAIKTCEFCNSFMILILLTHIDTRYIYNACRLNIWHVAPTCEPKKVMLINFQNEKWPSTLKYFLTHLDTQMS